MTAYTDFLADPKSRHVWLFEVNGRNIAADTLSTYYFSNARYATQASDSLVSRRFDALIAEKPNLTHELQGASGPIAGLLPARTGGSVRLVQKLGNLDLGTLTQLGGVHLHDLTFAGRSAIVRHGGYSPRLGRWLTYAEFKVVLNGNCDGEPEIGVDDVTFRLASKDKAFEYPVQDRTFWGLGYGLHFDGTNDQIDFGTDSTFNFTTSAFTVEFPLLIEANPAALKTIVTRGAITTNGWQICLNTNSKLGIFTSQSGASQESKSTALVHGRKCWISVVRDGAAVRIYIDGILSMDTSATHVDPATSSSNLYFGRNNAGTQFVNCLASELRIWNVARTKNQINSTMHRPLTTSEVTAASATLKLYARFNEGTGTLAADSTGTAADGTISGATWVHSSTGHAGLTGEKLDDLWGPFDGWSPTLIDAPRRIYFLSSHPIDELTDVPLGGKLAAITAGTTYTSLLTFLTSTTTAGQFDLCKVAGGSFLRLGSEPTKAVTVKGNGNAPGGTYLETAAAQVRYIICNRGLTPFVDPTDLDTTSFTALDTANSAPCGHAWRGDVTIAEVIAVPLRTVGAVGWVRHTSGLFAVERIEGASGKSAVITLTERDITRGTLTPLPRGVPHATVKIFYNRNYTRLGPNEMLTGVSGTDREHFVSKDWQEAGQTDWAAKVDFKNAKTMELETGFSEWADAMAEAIRLLALYNASDQAIQIHVRQRGVELDRMDAVYLHFQDRDRYRRKQDRLGTSATARFLVFDTSPDAQRGGQWLSLWREEII